MFVCPGLEESIAKFRATHQANKDSWGRGSRKLLILVPLDANISHKLEDEDDNIRFLDNLPNNEIDRAGIRGRVYKHSVYSVLDGDGKVGEDVKGRLRCRCIMQKWYCTGCNFQTGGR